MTRNGLLGALLLLTACGTARQDVPNVPVRSIAIVGVNVVAMTNPVVVARDQTVVIEGDRITAVGARRDVRVPAGARRIDRAGDYLMPGLVDAHVHLEYFETPAMLRQFLAYGVTTVRNMDGRPHLLAWREQIRAGTLLGPRIVTAGPILDGAPPLLPDNVSVASPDAARDAVRQQASAGYDFIKVYTNLSPSAYSAIVDAARDAQLPVAGHVPRSVSLETAAESQAAIEHLTDIGRWIEADDSPLAGKWHWSKLLIAAPIAPLKLTAVARRLAAAGTAVVPTMLQAERSVGSAEELSRWLQTPEVANLPPEFRTEWESRVRRASARLEGDDWHIVERGLKQRAAVVNALREAGVRLLVGTDTPNAFVVPGFSMHEELQRLTSSGASAEKALAAATRVPCEFLGLDCGVVAPGRRADLLITENNPLHDPANLRPVLVVVAGRPYPVQELRSRTAVRANPSTPDSESFLRTHR